MITVKETDKAASHGFFCYKSKPRSEGYRRKLAWLEDRFAEGLQIRIIREGTRSVGFIEYTPGESAWRPVKAPGYLFVHCLWVVGRSKLKGYGSRLLNACVEDARAMGKHGVAALTRTGGHLVGKKLFLKHGFEALDRAPPSFELVARVLDQAPAPVLPRDWDDRAARYGEGLTVVYADQCPYFADAVTETLRAAEEFGVDAPRAVQLRSAQEVQDLAPSPYGTFGIVYDGTMLSQTPLGARRLIQRLEERGQEGHG
jgi:GNAT superfamily N-acetyltransferase